MLKRLERRIVPRYWSNHVLRMVMVHLSEYESVVNVSGWLDQDKEGHQYRQYFPQAREYHITNFPSDSKRGMSTPDDLELDLMRPLPCEFENRYDIAFNHTVLEHVADPAYAFSQIALMSSDLVITVVPWKQKLHFEPGSYGDYYRMSPFVMRELHRINGLTILFEEYTPPPALDVYLMYVGSKEPHRHADFPRRVRALEELNMVLGEVHVDALAWNILHRVASKVFPLRLTDAGAKRVVNATPEAAEQASGIH